MQELLSIQDAPKTRGGVGVHDAIVFIDEKTAGNYYRQFAVHRTCEAIEKYRNAAKFIKDPRAHSLLYYIAQRKSNHALNLQGRNGNALQENLRSMSVSDSVSFTRYLLDVDLKPLSSLEETFLFILKNEQGTFEVYKKFAQNEGETEIRALFDLLLELQSSDIEALKIETARLKRMSENQLEESANSGFSHA
jgi:hypothetical protein